jgi:hypothetical protein
MVDCGEGTQRQFDYSAGRVSVPHCVYQSPDLMIMHGARSCWMSSSGCKVGLRHTQIPLGPAAIMLRGPWNFTLARLVA